MTTSTPITLNDFLAPLLAFFSQYIVVHFPLFTFDPFSSTVLNSLLSKMKAAKLLTTLSASLVLHVSGTSIVKTNNGSISGLFIDAYNQDAYLGIPFAQPPIGPLRFANPAPYNESWDDEVREFTEYGPACWSSSGTDTVHQEHSEDCLTLNVVRPHGDYGKLPVGIWIHGGGFEDGSGSRDAYNLSFIIEKSVEIGQPFIGVTINYRLNGFGFLNSRQVGANGWTNVGLRDQIKAIEWVHENIASFGGDPEHLVLWGESAGAISIGKLLNSNLLGAYIKGAIMESGSSLIPGVEYTGSKQEIYESVVSYFDCEDAVDTLECLQYVDEEELAYVFNSTNGVISKAFGFPYVDGDVIPKSSLRSLLEGAYYKVPVLIGTNTDEGSYFLSSAVNSTEDVFNAFAKTFPYLSNSSISHIQSLYPNDDLSLGAPLDPTYNTSAIEVPDTFGEYWSVGATAFGDSYFIGPARITAKILSADRVPVYKYRFNICDKSEYETAVYYGAAHFQEVVYVFNNNQAPEDTSYGQTWHPDTRSPNISSTMSKLWASFISDLDPNVVSDDLLEVENRGGWPAYFDSQQNLVFDLNGIYLEEDNWREDQIEYIQSVGNQLYN